MAAAPAASRIFVSYARSDGKKFAAELRSRLQDEHHFPLWQDLADLEGGKDWWQQITDAIDHVEFLVLIMTPAALRSEYVRREWRYARQQGRCVIPVIGAKGIDFDSLPDWMRRAHFVNPAEPDQWRRFVRTLEAPCKATRAPFMVEDLPQVFVRRPRELESLVASLLDQTGEEPVAITAALKGAGGYGKTTLARAICHEEAVQNAFDDGILWVTLGEQPGDVQSRVVDLIEVLTSERPGFQTTEAAVTRLGEVIGERRMLIVIDDVWQAAHARPFLQAGPNCAHLITTRNRDALPHKAKALDVDAMTESEAIKLLRFGLPDGEGATFARLAQRLGEWPLLLKLVNGALHKRIADREPLAAALAWVNGGLDRRGLTAFDARDPVERGDAVAKTLGVSLELFTEDERARFAELAIFPEDVDIPLAAVETLWSRTAGFDEFETELLCTRLYDQSLLLGLDLRTRRIRLHDVIRAYLVGEQKERLPALHAELVEAYRERCPDGWHAGPNDGYFFQYLPLHLREAGRAEELQKLLFGYRWLRAKLEAVGLPGLIRDFEQLGTDEQAHKIAAGLHLSAHALGSDLRQLPSQLLGRFALDDGAGIAALLIDTREQADRPALIPVDPSLTPPGTGLIRIFAGHRGSVGAVAALPERGQALSAGGDGTVRLWDLDNGKEVRRFEVPGGGAVAVLRDGKRALFASYGVLSVWSLENGTELRCFECHSWGRTTVAALPDGKRALTGCEDGTLRLWDLQSGAELCRFEGHSSEIAAVAVLPDGKHALSSSWDNTLRLWDLESGTELRCFECHSWRPMTVVPLPDGERALFGSSDGMLRLWDLKPGTEIRHFEGHYGVVTAVAALPDGKRALCGFGDNTLRLFELESGAELRRYYSGVEAVAVLPDGKRALSGGYDGTLRLWDLETTPEVGPFDAHGSPVMRLAMLPDGKRALSCSWDDTLRLLEVESGTELRRIQCHHGMVMTVAALPDGKRALFSSFDGKLHLLDLESGLDIRSFEGHRIETDGYSAVVLVEVRVLPDGKRALSHSGDETLRLWDLEGGAELSRFEGHDGRPGAFAVLSNGKQALCGSDDGTLSLLDLESGAELRRFEGHSTEGERSQVVAVAELPDGQHALSGYDDGTLCLWDLASGEQRNRLSGHSREVSAMAVMPDGQGAVSGSDDRTLRLWDLATGRELAVFAGDAPFSCCAITPDGRYVVAGDSAGQVHVLEILL